eukprot:gene16493-18133_t
MIPPLYGLRKDHKACIDQEKGPPTRPVCGANVSSNYRISHFLSMVIRPFFKESVEVCESTEDLLSRIKECNKHQDLSRSIIGSMDVVALYPSIDIDFSTKKCQEMIEESDMEFRNVNVRELGLYLALTLSKEDLCEENVERFCPTRLGKGRTPTITSSGTSKNEEKRWSGWNEARQEPRSNSEIRRMIALALRNSLRVTLKNHTFKFNDKFYRQTKGGAIGVGIAGDVANLFMVWWDRVLKERLSHTEIKMQMYSRYVDDIDIVCTAVSNPVDTEMPDKSAMKMVQNVANSIHESIQVTIDFPSNHENGRMPVLDTEQWIEKVNVNGAIKNQVLHSHYMKKISSKHLINKGSALSNEMKSNVLVADLVRVMRNVSLKCDEEERMKHIQHYINRMQFSGYKQNERVNTYKRAKGIFDKMIQRDQEGECPLTEENFGNARKDKVGKRKRNTTGIGKRVMK